MDTKQLPPVLEHVTASADKLAACPTVKEALEAILRDEKLTLADQIAITEVEARFMKKDALRIWSDAFGSWVLQM